MSVTQNNSPTYVLGQIIYVVLRKEATVYPMQIIEILSKKTLDGEAITYMVKVGGTAEKTIAINDIDGEIFDSSEKAKSVLIDRVSVSIKTRVDNAVAKAKEWYPTGSELTSSAEDSMSIIKKITSRDNNVSQDKQKVPRQELADFAAELRAESIIEEGSIIELPDGTKAKVKSLKIPANMQ